MGGQRKIGNQDGWVDIISEDVKRKAKEITSFGGISYADVVRKIRSKEGNHVAAGGKHQQQPKKQHNQQQSSGDKKGKRGGGQYVVCPTTDCKGFAYTAQMAGDSVTCSLCNALYPRAWLSAEQQNHWDCLAEFRGIAADDSSEVKEIDSMDVTPWGEQKDEAPPNGEVDELAGKSLKELEVELQKGRAEAQEI